MSTITAHQAVFGQRGFTHALLAETPGSNAFVSMGTIEADLPGEAPAGVVWQPFIRGWATGACYLFSLTALDPVATRPGMVRTRMLAVPIERVPEVADLAVIWSCLETAWDGEAVLPLATLSAGNGPSKAAPSISPVLLEIANRFTEGTVRDGVPVVLNGQDRFRALVAELWLRMPPGFRRELNFGFTFMPPDLKERNLHLACCPAALAERWRAYPNFACCDGTGGHTTTASGYLLGLPEGDSVERFLSEAELAKPTLRTFGGFVRAATDWFNREKLDFGGLCSLARDLAQLAPHPAKAAGMKLKLMNALAARVRAGETENLLPLRNLRITPFGPAITVLADTITARVEARLKESSNQGEGDLIKIFEAMSRPASAEWLSWVTAGITAAISPASPPVAASVWRVWGQMENLFDPVAQFIPTGSTHESVWAKTIPERLTESLGEKLIAWSDARGWWLLHAKALLTFNPWDQALRIHVNATRRTGELVSVNFLMAAASASLSVSFAVHETDLRVRQCAAKLCIENPAVLFGFDAGEAGWRDILLLALAGDKKLVRQMSNARAMLFSLLDVSLGGARVQEKLFAAFAWDKTADLTEYPQRQNVWAVLPTSVRREFLVATAAGWLARFLAAPDKHVSVERELLLEVFGSSLKGKRFYHQIQNLVGGGLALFQKFSEATEECFIEWLNTVSGSSQRLSWRDASELAVLLKQKGWETGARCLEANGAKPGRGDIAQAWDKYWNSLGKFDKLLFRIPVPFGHNAHVNRQSASPSMETTETTALFVTALEAEFKAVCSHLDGVEEKVSKGSIYAVGQFRCKDAVCDVVVAQTGMGNAKSAVETERAIQQFSPKYAFFVGIAGGLKKELKIGDIVAADKVYGYEVGKAASVFRPRPEAPWTSYDATQRARAVARDDKWIARIVPSPIIKPNAFVKPVAAGEKVVDSHKAEVFQLLAQNYGDAYAVAMEDLGFSYAAHANSNVTFAVVRGISDFAAKKAHAEMQGSQEVAAKHAAAFAFQMLEGLVRGASTLST